MNYEEKILKIVEFVKKNSQADDFNLNINLSNDTFFRFGENRVTQNGTGEFENIYLTSAFGQKTGSASINSSNENDILKIIKQSEEIARLNKDDPEFIPSAEKVTLPEVNNFSEVTANLKPLDLVDNIEKTIKRASSEQVNCAGITENSIYRQAYASKNGFYGYSEKTTFKHSMTFFDQKRETKNVTEVKDYSKFSIETELEKISSKLNALNEPKQSEIGKIPVILTPQAVANYFAYLMYSFSRRSTDLGMNCFSGKIGKKVFGEKFNLKSVINDQDLITTKFSYDGLPAQNIDWVSNGVLNVLRTTRDWAKMKNLVPNFMCNWLIEGGNATVDEMMKKVDRGLLINNFWYIRQADAKNGVWTGLTRDGVNYFEDGVIKNSVTNLRFNESHTEMSKRILALGNLEQTGFGTKVPWMLVDDFNFVDVTTF